MDDIKGIVAGLSAAQREYLTTKAVWRKPSPTGEWQWMTFPPANTHQCLMKLALVDGNGRLSARGFAARTHMLDTGDK